MPFERGKALRYGEVEIPWDVKLDGDIRNRRQEDELNSEKYSTGGPPGKTCLVTCKKDLGVMVETVEAGGNDTKNPFGQKTNYLQFKCQWRLQSPPVERSSAYIQVVARGRFN